MEIFSQFQECEIGAKLSGRVRNEVLQLLKKFKKMLVIQKFDINLLSLLMLTEESFRFFHEQK